MAQEEEDELDFSNMKMYNQPVEEVFAGKRREEIDENGDKTIIHDLVYDREDMQRIELWEDVTYNGTTKKFVFVVDTGGEAISKIYSGNIPKEWYDDLKALEAGGTLRLSETTNGNFLHMKVKFFDVDMPVLFSLDNNIKEGMPNTLCWDILKASRLNCNHLNDEIKDTIEVRTNLIKPDPRFIDGDHKNENKVDDNAAVGNDPGRKEKADGTIEHMIEFTGTRILIKEKINLFGINEDLEEKELQWMVDTGWPRASFIPIQNVDALWLDHIRFKKEESSKSIGTWVRNHLTLWFNNKVLLCEYTRDRNPDEDENIIGWDILRASHLSCDFPNRIMKLTIDPSRIESDPSALLNEVKK